MFPHIPSTPLPFTAEVHAWHVPEQLELQQTPSTQYPLEHSVPKLQSAPSPSSTEPLEQAPNPLQTPRHSLSGSSPLPILPQVPSAPFPIFATVQAWQTPEQTELQQTPSTQNPVAQSEGLMQGVALDGSATSLGASVDPFMRSPSSAPALTSVVIFPPNPNSSVLSAAQPEVPAIAVSVAAQKRNRLSRPYLFTSLSPARTTQM